jgi:aminoglycoside phosphotransferase (APT) family kinase protein
VKGRLRQRTQWIANSGLFADLSGFQEHPLVQRSLPADIVAAMLDLWADRESFLAALDELPQTLQHGDAGRKNLYLRRSDASHAETIAIDWGWSGPGPLGSELAPLVASASLWFIDVQPEDLPEVDHIAFAGYLQGLREAGWCGDAKLARLGHAASLALRFAPLLGWFELAASPCVSQ